MLHYWGKRILDGLLVVERRLGALQSNIQGTKRKSSERGFANYLKKRKTKRMPIGKCTVITPCYNPGKYLIPMLESVAAQGDCVAKHVIMDGGSTDGTVEVLAKWVESHPNVEFFSEKDKGQSDACRKALERVETDYFCWLNADDVLRDRGLEHLLAGVAQDQPAIVYGDYLRIDGEGRVFAERRQPSFRYWDCLHGYLTIQNASAIFNAKQLRAAGGFDVSLRFVMDYDIILKLARSGKVKHVRYFCGAFRVHSTSKTTTLDDVCQKETEDLRARYGVPKNVQIRKLLSLIAKCRVFIRMCFEGCLKGRLYK